QRGQEQPAERHHVHGDEVIAVAQREDRRVDVGHERRLAVRDILIEAPALAQNVGLHGQIGFIGVEDGNREGGRAQYDQHPEQQERDLGRVCGAGWRCASHVPNIAWTRLRAARLAAGGGADCWSRSPWWLATPPPSYTRFSTATKAPTGPSRRS